MASLLYLPRIFVYHSDPDIIKQTSSTFKIMEWRLYWYISVPSAILTWITGIILTFYVELEVWLILKIFFVLSMTIFHYMCGIWLKNFAYDINSHSKKFYRFINEIPTILLIIIAILVVFKF